jgi:CheY-like chemotaxis protein
MQQHDRRTRPVMTAEDNAVTAGLERAGSTIPAQPSGTAVRGFSAMVVDDHPLVRESMVNRLNLLGAREVVEAATAGEARARAHASGPRELCILDIGLPDGSGLDLLADLRAAGWQRLVVLSAADDAYSVRAAFVAGAQGLPAEVGLPARRRRRRAPGAGRRGLRDPSVASLLAAGPARRPLDSGVNELSGPRDRGAPPGRGRPVQQADR